MEIHVYFCVLIFEYVNKVTLYISVIRYFFSEDVLVLYSMSQEWAINLHYK